MAPPPRSFRMIFTCVLLNFLAAAFMAAPAAADETCVPSLQRLLSCLDFIEHRSDEIPVPCCIQVNRTVAEQPCCLMHVVRGNAGRLIGPEYDNTRAMVNVTTKCLGDASVLMSITRSCSGSLSNSCLVSLLFCRPCQPKLRSFLFLVSQSQASRSRR